MLKQMFAMLSVMGCILSTMPSIVLAQSFPTPFTKKDNETLIAQFDVTKVRFLRREDWTTPGGPSMINLYNDGHLIGGIGAESFGEGGTGLGTYSGNERNFLFRTNRYRGVVSSDGRTMIVTITDSTGKQTTQVWTKPTGAGGTGRQKPDE